MGRAAGCFAETTLALRRFRYFLTLSAPSGMGRARRLFGLLVEDGRYYMGARGGNSKSTPLRRPPDPASVRGRSQIAPEYDIRRGLLRRRVE